LVYLQPLIDGRMRWGLYPATALLALAAMGEVITLFWLAGSWPGAI
jgi:hypothetical protein